MSSIGGVKYRRIVERKKQYVKPILEKFEVSHVLIRMFIFYFICMTKMRGFWPTIFLMCGIFLSFSFVSTENAKVIINEIGAYEEAGYEWIEIFNRSEEEVDLTGWRFWEGGVNHGLSLKQGGGVLSPGAFALIVQDDQKFLQKYPTVTATVFDSAWGNLNEDGEEIGLKFSSGENDFVEKFTYISAGEFSLERKDLRLDDYSENNWKEHESGNTAGAINSSVTEELPQVGEEENHEGEETLEHQEEPESNQAPVAQLTVSSSSIFLGTSLMFDATSSTDDGNIEKYFWNFGDGGFGEGGIINHEYLSVGTFQVELVIEDNMGISSSVTTSVIVSEFVETEEVFVPSTSRILINEFVSDPSEGKEWIELFNVSTTSVNLMGFTLNDGTGVVATATLMVEAGSFLVIELSSSKLNNGGDSIILKNSEGVVMDSVSYGDWEDENREDNAIAPAKGSSLARINSEDTNNDNVDFAQTTTVTKGNQNVITAPALPAPRQSSRSTSGRSSPSYPTTTNPSLPVTTDIVKGAIIINELFPNPKGSDTENEFIELYNTSSSSVNLARWKIGDNSNKRYTIQEKVIEPFSYAVFVSKITGIALNNTGEETFMLFDPNGNIIDTVRYHSTSTEEMSYAREKNSWNWTTTPTLGKENIFTLEQEEIVEEEEAVEKNDAMKESNVQVQNMAGLFISEIFPSPVKLQIKEFVEIGNDGDSVIELGGMFLDDMDGGSKPYKIPENTILEPQSYIVFSQEQTKIILNNTDDNVRLLDKNQDEILAVSYEQTRTNESYIIDENNNFVWTTTLTPGEQNVLTSINETSRQGAPQKVLGTKITTPLDVLLEDIRDLPKGEKIKTRGIVAAVPGVFGSQYFYIVDETSGIQIYNSKKDFPELTVGDVIEVTGEITIAYGETRLKTNSRADMVVLGQDGEIVPQEVEIVAIDKTFEGAFVKVNGEITEVKTNFMYIDDGTSEIKIALKSGSGIKKDAIFVGKTVSLKGIVSAAQGVYQISPRSAEDIEEVDLHEEEIQEEQSILEKDMPSTGELQQQSSSLKIFLTFLVGTGFLAVVGYMKRQILFDFWQRIKNPLKKKS